MSGEVTAIAGQVRDPVTWEVTTEAAAPAPSVTPSDLWKLVMSDCLQGRQEVLGVLAGMDDIPHLHRFPLTKIHVLDAFHDLRRALMHLDEAIKEIQTEFPDYPVLTKGQ